MDGWIRIGTEIDTKTFDAQIEQCEKELEELQSKIDNPDTIQVDTSEFDNRILAATEDLEHMKQLAAEGVPIATDGILNVEAKLRTLNDEKEKFIETQRANFIDKANVQAEKLDNKLIDLNVKKEKLMLDNSGSFLSGISSGTAEIIGQVGKWALAVFGVRTAYRVVSSAMSVISQYNAQIGADVEYIKYALAMSLEPVIKTIINLVYKALSLIALLIKNLTGINIFQNSGADKFAAGMKSGAASSKKIKDNLNTAKFDEITKLGNSTDTGAAGGGGGGGMPSFDLSEANNEVEALYNRIATIWNDIGKLMEDTLSNPAAFEAMYGNWATTMEGITMIGYGTYEVLDGFLDTLGGSAKILVGLITGDMDLVNEGAEQLVDGLGRMLDGLKNIVLGVLTTILGATGALIKSLYEVVGKIINWIWEQIKKLVSNGIGKLKEFGSWIHDKFIQPVLDYFAKLWEDIKNVFSTVDTWLENKFGDAYLGIKRAFGKVVDFVQEIWNRIMGIFSSIGSTIGEVLGAGFRGAVNGALSVVQNLLNKPINAINSLLGIINKVPGVNVSYIQPVQLPRLASGAIVNMPGRGVPLGNAITGEAGQEGILPLTNESTMEMLGEKIGKYINLTINLTPKLDGRVLAREVVKVNEQNSFIKGR